LPAPIPMTNIFLTTLSTAVAKSWQRLDQASKGSAGLTNSSRLDQNSRYASQARRAKAIFETSDPRWQGHR
jgi:hypothetical protein